MAMSTSIGALAKALSLAQGEMGHAIKDQENQAFKRGNQVSKYADLAAIIDAVREPFAKHGLSYSQPVIPHETLVCVQTILMHESGEWLTSEIWLKPKDQSPHAYGSCITYGRRFLLAAIAGVAQSDDDGNAASGVGDAREGAILNVIAAFEGCGSLDEAKALYDSAGARFTGDMDALARIKEAKDAAKARLSRKAAA